jgi:mannobiose 2-epimerase
MEKEDLLGLRDELERELKENILAWWMKHAPDPLHGGFYGHISHENAVVPGAGKGAVLNARILWTFAAAYRMFPDPDYLKTAERAFSYILEHFMDRDHGGVYWELTEEGKVSSSRKQVYALAFTLYALAEYHLASGDQQALITAIALFEDTEFHAFDQNAGGYTEALGREWEPLEDLRLSEKDENERFTMNTHLHVLEAYGNLYRTWKDPALESALEHLIRLFLEHFIDWKSGHLKLFFDERWISKSNLVSYGHDIECSWLLHKAAEILGKEDLRGECAGLAVKMARTSFEGLDRDGGLFYEFFPDTGHLDTDKHWWPQAEALVGYFNAWQLSGDPEFLVRARESWAFIHNYICDWVEGEWFWSVDREGLPQTEKEKAGFWKCPYHNGRACLEVIRRIEGITEHHHATKKNKP